jgi:heat shock protein HtpX
MNQKQWIPNDESLEKNLSYITQTNRNILGIVFVLFSLIGLVVGQIIIGLAVGVVAAFAVQRLISASTRNVFNVIAATVPASELHHARIFNVIDGLCVVSGDQRPAVRIVDSAFPVATVLVGADGKGIIAVSESFARTMDRVEVEAVMAHLLWRLRMGHPQLIGYLSGVTSVLSKVGLGSIAARMGEKALPQELVLWADIAACQATRFPPALVSALEKSVQSRGDVSVGVADALCFVLPVEAESDTNRVRKVSNVVLARPLVAERVAILKEI